MAFLVGSEGTLGIATKMVCRIMCSPERVLTMLCIYSSVEAAGQTVSDIVAEGIIPATLEIMDNLVIRAVEGLRPCGLSPRRRGGPPHRAHGLTDGMDEQMKRITGYPRKRRRGELPAREGRERAEYPLGPGAGAPRRGGQAPARRSRSGTGPCPARNCRKPFRR